MRFGNDPGAFDTPRKSGCVEEIQWIGSQEASNSFHSLNPFAGKRYVYSPFVDPFCFLVKGIPVAYEKYLCEAFFIQGIPSGISGEACCLEVILRRPAGIYGQDL